MIRVFVIFTFYVITFAVVTEKRCYNALSCPNAPFDSDDLIDYNNDRTMTMHSDYMDVFCTYLSEAVVCTKDYEDVCRNETKELFKLMRSCYKPVCEDYKNELTAMIEPCFNDPTYQREFLKCYEEAVEIKHNAPSTAKDCGIDTWANCTHGIMKRCSPQYAYVVFPIVEASKPHICLI